jgi:hypothetical protein
MTSFGAPGESECDATQLKMAQKRSLQYGEVGLFSVAISGGGSTVFSCCELANPLSLRPQNLGGHDEKVSYPASCPILDS